MNPGTGSSGTAPQWWLDPALARLAFGTGSRARSTGAWADDERLDIDLDDPEQRALGEFELLELIGEGGMGLVYRARQNRLRREVAVKLLSAGPWASEDFIARFQEEARHAAQLQHPGIVAIHEMGELDGLVYYAMQLVRGESLAQRLQRQGGRLPERQAAQLLRTIAEAVDYAHSLGVLHLDLKPANVLIDENGQAKIADFGLARRLESEHDALTNEHIAGTPSYMAPEQASIGKAPLTRVTDVWGLGAILYEVLCGQPPFEAADASSTLALLQKGVLRKPSRIVPMSADLEAICLKCLAKAPANRYSSARALADDLGRFLEGREVGVRPLGGLARLWRWARREPRMAMALALIALSLVTGLLATSMQWRRAELHAGEVRDHLWAQRLEAAAAALEAQTPLEALPILVANLAEQEAAGEQAEAEDSRLRIAMALAQAPVLIDRIASSDTRIVSLAIDPQADWLAVASDFEVSLYDLASGERRWVTGLEPGTSGALSLADDGRHLFVTRYENAVGANDFLRMRGEAWQVLVSLADGRVVEPWSSQEEPPSAIVFSPDGSHALLGYHDPDSGPPLFHLREVASGRVLGEPRPMHRGTQLLAPRAAALAVGPFNERASGFRVERLELRDPGDFELRWRHHLEGGEGIRAWEFSPDAGRLAVGYYSGQVLLFDVATGQATELGPRASDTIYELRFSEDGGWLAAASGDGEIRVFDLEAGRLLVSPLRLGEGRTMVQLSRAQRSLFATGDSDEPARLWRLPERPGQAEVVVGKFPRHGGAHRGFAAQLQPGLLATSGLDGEVRVWRLHAPEAWPEPAAPIPNATPPVQGDGGLVAVRDRELRLFDPDTGQPLGPSVTHPQAVAFAAPRPGGDEVLSVAGPWLAGHDGRSGTVLFDPVALPASPSAMLPNPDGVRLILTFHQREQRHNRLLLESRGAASGALLATTTLPGSFWRLRYSQRGDVLLAWRFTELRLLATDTLTPVREPLWSGPDMAAHRQQNFDGDAESATLPLQLEVREAALGSDGRSLWLGLGRAGEEGYQLRLIDLASGEQRLSVPLPHFPLAMESLDGGERVALLVLSEQMLLLYDANGAVRRVAIKGLHAGSRLASSPDGRRLAVSVEGGIRMYDSRKGRWLSPQLSLPIAADSGELVFAADSRVLTLRADDGRAWRLPLAPESRPLGELQALARLLSPASFEAGGSRAPAGPDERAALRAADPGPPTPVAAPAPAWDIGFEPAQPRFVDLRPGCNRYYHDPADHLWFGLHLRQLPPPGRQRLLGGEFELRCALLAAWRPDSEASVALGSRIEGIPVVPQHGAAVHVLATGGSSLRAYFTEMPYAWLELGYADGSRARLPLLWRRDLMDLGSPMVDFSDAAVAYAGIGGTGSRMSLQIPIAAHLYVSRLENPHPERELVSLAWESVRAFASHPILLAVTVEPVAGSGALPPDWRSRP